jgi:hypothetical protein
VTVLPRIALLFGAQAVYCMSCIFTLIPIYISATIIIILHAIVVCYCYDDNAVVSCYLKTPEPRVQKQQKAIHKPEGTCW